MSVIADDYRFAFRSKTGACYELQHNTADGVGADVSTTTGGYVLEARIPWSIVGLAAPAAGVVVGTDVHGRRAVRRFMAIQ